jgi:putative hydrolase of the HAD superfamily
MPTEDLETLKPETLKAPFKNIFFDVGNTLLFQNHARILAPLHAKQIHPTREVLHDLERRTKRDYDRLVKNQHADHSFWWMFYTRLLNESGGADDLVRDELVELTRQSANWDTVLPGTRQLLDSIGSRHRIGVISNADGKIEEVLARCSIADCFLTITDSGLVGHEKPHPAIFEAAFREMQAQPDESLYVGDVYSVDYVGATQAGMQAVLMDVSGAYKDDVYPRVESLNELEVLLDELRVRT